MKTLICSVFVILLMTAFSCQKESDEEFDGSVDLKSLKSAQPVLTFQAHLSGDSEVPAVDTKAVGETVFMVSKDSTKITYQLIVANLENVRMAHIHLAPAGVNGSVVVWLYPAAPPAVLIEGTSNGILAKGIISAENLTGSLQGMPLTALIEAMRTGTAYVNVHTIKYGGGEIRGQIE